MYQEASANALHTVPFVPGNLSASGGVGSTPPPATARATYLTSYQAALQALHNDPSGVRLRRSCVLLHACLIAAPVCASPPPFSCDSQRDPSAAKTCDVYPC